MGWLAALPQGLAGPAQQLSDALLEAALHADEHRPNDDTTVVVIRTHDLQPAAEVEVRRMTVSFPVPPI
jgi:hypothetical protein